MVGIVVTAAMIAGMTVARALLRQLSQYVAAASVHMEASLHEQYTSKICSPLGFVIVNATPLKPL